MGFLLKTLSLLTGSSEELLLNARAEVSNNLGSGSISSESERTFVFDRFLKFLKENGLPRELENEPTGVILAIILDILVQDKKNHKFIQVNNRVLVDFYNYELGNNNTLMPALMKMGVDFEKYLERKGI